jgi:type II secretory pathway pseudopilin PulG
VLTRRGATLVELLVAMALSTVVLGAASSSLMRQRRTSDLQLSRARTESQLRAAIAALQVALEGMSPAAGDLAAGEARDTAVQLRTMIGSAIACDSAVGRVTIAADDTSGDRVSGLAAAPKIGDTLWWHVPGSPGWIARKVTDVSSAVSICAVGLPEPQALLRLGFALPDTVPKGAPVRITRVSRYTFYHAGDGSWQLGISEWSDMLRAFAPPQPVAGPLARTAPDGTRTGLRYFDLLGGELHDAGQGVDVMRVARVRVTLVVPEGATSVQDASLRRDSVDIALGRGP